LADEFGYMAEDVASADEFCHVAYELDEYSAAMRGIQFVGGKLPRHLENFPEKQRKLQLKSSAESTATTNTAIDIVGSSEHFKRPTLAQTQDRTPSPLSVYSCPVFNTPPPLEEGDAFEKHSDADALTAAANKCHGQERGRRKHRQEGNGKFNEAICNILVYEALSY
jgi:hypothetical protein